MKIVILFLSFILAINCKAQQNESSTYTKVGDTVPEFSFEVQKGKTVSIRDYKGKLVLINLFATWCPPCNVELPLMQELIWKKHKNNPRFSLLIFGREEGWGILDSFKIKKGFEFPLFPDTDRKIFSSFAEGGIPRNILVDENGKIIYQSLGFEEDEFKNLIKLIDDHLTTKQTIH